MISNPNAGWCDFKLGTFEGTPSYTTDVPVDLLTAFIDYHYKGTGMAWFDEEGSEFTLILTPYSLFIIEENEEAESILHDFSKMNIRDLEKELIEDIEKDLNNWVKEFTVLDNDQEELLQHRNEIRQKIAILKEMILK